MKFITIAVLLLICTISVRSQQDSSQLVQGLFSIMQGFAAPAQPAQPTGQVETQGGCLNVALDLIMYLYGELQSILAGKVVPDQMYMMVQGFILMGKFNSAKQACLPQ